MADHSEFYERRRWQVEFARLQISRSRQRIQPSAVSPRKAECVDGCGKFEVARIPPATAVVRKTHCGRPSHCPTDLGIGKLDPLAGRTCQPLPGRAAIHGLEEQCRPLLSVPRAEIARAFVDEERVEGLSADR